MSDRAGAATIPQIFIGGRHVGGATETFDASNDGSLKALLAGVGIDVAPESQGDAYGFLPKWLHPRGTAATANHEAA
jgi:cysteine synthase A